VSPPRLRQAASPLAAIDAHHTDSGKLMENTKKVFAGKNSQKKLYLCSEFLVLKIQK